MRRKKKIQNEKQVLTAAPAAPYSGMSDQLPRVLTKNAKTAANIEKPVRLEIPIPTAVLSDRV
ncbi:hypothetical protein MSSD14B_08250 [Marinobacter salsuginis]|uniref:Uncharacterized protein n=1 Tax=Marinobacter salsuginis TaxID=418719 RepID=A0A5M3PWF2_9GAMM|nr:hypothetical protein MSSD14B_08250 [Marinobacter salsuginis]